MRRGKIGGQSSAEFLALAAGILLTATSLLYIGLENNELSSVLQAARDGAEEAIATIELSYGCPANVENLRYNEGKITISLTLIFSPQDESNWTEFKENVVKKMVREYALNCIRNAVSGQETPTAVPVKTIFHTYDVSVDLREVFR